MELRISIAICVLCSTAFAANSPTDAERVQGAWQVTETVVDGIAEKEAKGTKIRFVDDRIVFEDDETEEPTRFQLRRNKKTREIDLLRRNDKGKPELIARGIYRFEGAELSLCFAFDQQPIQLCIVGESVAPRPIDFDTKRPIKGYQKAILTLARPAKE